MGGGCEEMVHGEGAQGVIGEAEICNAQDPGSRAREGHLLFYPWHWGAALLWNQDRREVRTGSHSG